MTHSVQGSYCDIPLSINVTAHNHICVYNESLQYRTKMMDKWETCHMC